MQYVLLLFHIVLKFTLHLWQVPRSSVGRALYRESGPSQDGDPVPGNLPFFVGFFFYIFFFWKVLFFSEFVRKSEITWKILVYPSFYLITLAKVFFRLLTNLPFSYTLKLGTVIGMLLNRNVVKSNNFFLWETYLRAQTLGVPWNQVVQVIHAVCVRGFTLFLHSWIRDMHRNAPKSERY